MSEYIRAPLELYCLELYVCVGEEVAFILLLLEVLYLEVIPELLTELLLRLEAPNVLSPKFVALLL